MGFSVQAFLFALGCCVVSMSIAGSSANKKDNKEWLEGLTHPDNALMVKYVNFIGFGFYLLFGYVLYRLFTVGDVACIIITVVIILLMGLCPPLLYKTKNLRLFVIANLSFFLLIPVLILLLVQSNLALAVLVTVYQLWFIYDLSYWYRLMKLNAE